MCVCIVREDPIDRSSRVLGNALARGDLGNDSKHTQGGQPKNSVRPGPAFSLGTSRGRLAACLAHYPGVSTREIKEKTGFEISIPDRIRTTEPPTVEELRVLRSQVDRDGIYTER